MGKFKVVSEYTPSGDQPQAIDTLASGIENGLRDQVLLGVTGSGKTYTMAKVIERVQRPTLVLAHNKTLAAQLCEEFRAFFPENAVEYFVSYYDYYQPEAYIPHTDTFIEKDAAINDEIERLRHSATAALFERRDVIVVSSVSCIYGLGDPIDYANMVISLRQGKEYPRDQLLRKLVEIRYERNDIAFDRNMFRVRGDTVEIYPVYANGYAIRVEFFGDEIDRISQINPVTGQAQRVLQHVAIYPASHYVTTKDKMERAAAEIERELAERKKEICAYDRQTEILENFSGGIERLKDIYKEKESLDTDMVKTYHTLTAVNHRNEKALAVFQKEKEFAEKHIREISRKLDTVKIQENQEHLQRLEADTEAYARDIQQLKETWEKQRRALDLAESRNDYDDYLKARSQWEAVREFLAQDGRENDGILQELQMLARLRFVFDREEKKALTEKMEAVNRIFEETEAGRDAPFSKARQKRRGHRNGKLSHRWGSYAGRFRF